MRKILLLTAFVFMLYAFPIKTSAYDMQELIEYTEFIGSEYCICPELLQAIIYHESSWKPTAKNGNCIGLMQISKASHSDRMKKVAEKYGYDEDLENPYFNMAVGCDYLAELFEEYHDAGLVLMKYHGERKAEYNAEHGILSSYADKILTESERLEREHGK